MNGIINYDDHKSSLSILIFWLQDLPNAMTTVELTDELDLHNVRNREWLIPAPCATSGDGLYEGLDWLSTEFKKRTWSCDHINHVKISRDLN